MRMCGSAALRREAKELLTYPGRGLTGCAKRVLFLGDGINPPRTVFKDLLSSARGRYNMLINIQISSNLFKFIAHNIIPTSR